MARQTAPTGSTSWRPTLTRLAASPGVQFGIAYDAYSYETYSKKRTVRTVASAQTSSTRTGPIPSAGDSANISLIPERMSSVFWIFLFGDRWGTGDREAGSPAHGVGGGSVRQRFRLVREVHAVYNSPAWICTDHTLAGSYRRTPCNRSIAPSPTCLRPHRLDPHPPPPPHRPRVRSLASTA